MSLRPSLVFRYLASSCFGGLSLITTGNISSLKMCLLRSSHVEVIAIPPDNSCRIVPERCAVCLIRCLVDHSEAPFVTINDYGVDTVSSMMKLRTQECFVVWVWVVLWWKVKTRVCHPILFFCCLYIHLVDLLWTHL